ncbi:hypothetical protein SHKM778_91720 [Streptomyces sp. KM77-8]|uniref:Uncharacterized protein n=1 Tax=Streptomyces haneummycinicus TaxID=3074435 RepID=A0AAT9HZZ9_9ACTN
MASNPPAPEAPFKPSDTFAYGAGRTDEGPFEEWNPTADSSVPYVAATASPSSAAEDSPAAPPFSASAS